MKVIIISALLIIGLMGEAVDARCRGANGWCTRAAKYERERYERERVALDRVRFDRAMRTRAAQRQAIAAKHTQAKR